MKKYIVLSALLCNLCFASDIHIVGIDCLNLVKFNSGQDFVVVCIRPLQDTKTYLLKIQNNFDFITESYRLLLFRDPDPAGEAWWLDQLNRNLITKGYMIDAIINSDEYKNLSR